MHDSLANHNLSEQNEGQLTEVYVRTRILVVEDDVGCVRLVKRGFAAAGDRYEVTFANSLQDAREILNRETFDLVICELLLPDGRGTELLARAMDVAPYDGPRMPLVLLTSQDNEQTAGTAIQAGALDYVVKSEIALLALPRFAERAVRQWRQLVGRLKAECSLPESEARFHCLAETTNEGIWVTDATYKTIFTNEKMSALLGYRPSDLLGQSLFDFMDDGSRLDVYRRILQCHLGTTVRCEMFFKHQDGSDVRLLGSCSGTTDAGGAFTGLLGTFTGMPERMDLPSQLTQLDRFSSVGEVASVLAHEVNQPLGAVANYAGTCVNLIAENRLEMSDLKRVLERINEQCLRAGRIIGLLQRFACKAVPRQTTIDVNELVEVVKRLMILDKSWRTDIRLELDRCVPQAWGDPIQIQQILIILIQNAVDNASSDRCAAPIVITTTAHDWEVTISVRHQWERIAAPQQELVPDNMDGWGIGLSISRTVIGSQGGRLWITNNRSGGATIHLSLPMKKETADPSHHIGTSSKLPVQRETS